MTLRPPNQTPIDGRGLVWGLLLGAVVGGLVALFKAPLLRARTPNNNTVVTVKRQNPVVKTDATIPADPVAESRAQGKAAARRRRSELGV